MQQAYNLAMDPIGISEQCINDVYLALQIRRILIPQFLGSTVLQVHGQIQEDGKRLA